MSKTLGFVSFLAAIFLSACASGHSVPVEAITQPAPVAIDNNHVEHVSLLVPLQGDFATQGARVRDGFMAGYAKANSPKNIQIDVIDTQSYGTAYNAYEAALATHPVLVVGPLTKDAVNELGNQNTLPTPTLALNQSDPNGVAPINLFQFSLSPQVDAQKTADHMRQQGVKTAVLIAPEGDWGQGIASTYGKQWLAQGGQLSASLAYDANTDFGKAIPPLVETADKDTAVFLVATSEDAAKILPFLKKKIPIYALPMIYNGNNTAQLEGVHFLVSPYQKANPTRSTESDKLYAFGSDAYALAEYRVRTGGFEGLALSGNTGYLTVDPNGVIQRNLFWVTVIDNQLIDQPAAPSTSA